MYREFRYPVIDTKATGRNIKKLMDINRMSVNDIKEALGLNAPQSIYHWMNGSSLPSIDNMYALSTLFDTPIDSIIIGDRELSVPPRQTAFYRRIETYYKLIHQKRAG